ncbi:hypothetical protein [Cupriavidus nantongensis]|nr:hypothetical protein [Cupriavidus nantongensis]
MTSAHEVASKSLYIGKYEVPAAGPRILLFFAFWLGAPALALVISVLWRPAGVLTCLVWFAVAVGLFHLRNVVVRKEIEEGLHDPLYGAHLRRMRRRTVNERHPWYRWFKGAYSAVVTILIAWALVTADGAGSQVQSSVAPPMGSQQ